MENNLDLFIHVFLVILKIPLKYIKPCILILHDRWKPFLWKESLFCHKIGHIVIIFIQQDQFRLLNKIATLSVFLLNFVLKWELYGSYSSKRTLIPKV